VLKNGVPYEVAVNLDDAELTAYCIAFGEMEGNEWSWDRMSWIDKK
jgi:hypothetical protein